MTGVGSRESWRSENEQQLELSSSKALLIKVEDKWDD